MKLALRILRFIHPKAEAERMIVRAAIARAAAEAEDLTRTCTLNGPALKTWLTENGKIETK